MTIANATLTSTSLNVSTGVLTASVSFGQPPQYIRLPFSETELNEIANAAVPARSTYNLTDIRTAIAETLANTVIV